MKPTQAQIEAGDMLCTLDCAIVHAAEHGADGLANNLREIKAALIAAAEVETDTGACRTSHDFKAFTAAQAGETFDDGYKYKEAECRDEIADTIERCAQVVVNFPDKESLLEEIAAAIRKLKDET